MDVRTAQASVNTKSRSYGSARAFAELRDLLRDLPRPVDAATVADVLAECANPGEVLVVGVTGSVAAGKTTLCNAIATSLRSTLQVEVVSTDGFLQPNGVLEQKGLLLRKGYPETYDAELLCGALQRARWGPVRIPGYSHATYDRAAEFDRTIDRPDILIVEGLGLSPSGRHRDPAALLDLLVYVDASEEDLEAWFTSRFLKLWRQAEGNPASFYAKFRHLSEDATEAFAKQVWANINLPNLREHIAPARRQADLIISKTAEHNMVLSTPSFRGDA
jgi:type I pantothenate kinase